MPTTSPTSCSGRDRHCGDMVCFLPSGDTRLLESPSLAVHSRELPGSSFALALI